MFFCWDAMFSVQYCNYTNSRLISFDSIDYSWNSTKIYFSESYGGFLQTVFEKIN
jgi:hypothetical protein